MVWTPRQSRMLGTSDGVGASSAIAGLRSGAVGLAIGCAYLNAAPITSSRFTGDITLVLIFDRDLSHDEALSASDNPWQIFAPKSQPIWVPV